MFITLFDMAQRFVGTKETAGSVSNPLVLSMLRLDTSWVEDDAVAWCSAFVNFIAWLLRAPRSKSLAARSWLLVGRPVALTEAKAEGDVVILKRGKGTQPGADVIQAPGHVGFFAGLDVANKRVLVLGGNQGDAVSVAAFPIADVLGVRRLTEG